MSSILKALKKMEEEKASRRVKSIDLTSEILSSSKTTPRPRWQLPAIGGLILVIMLVTIYSLSIKILTPLSLQAPAITTALDPTAKTMPAGGQAYHTYPVKPIAAPIEKSATIKFPAQKQSKYPPDTLSVQQTPAVIPPSSPTAQQTVQATQPILPQVKPEKTESEKKASPVAESAGPTVAVSGIAWQKDSSTRLAIINGQPLGTGTSIEGVTVEEIMQDRVRFSYNKKSFEVFLGKSGKPH